jgi:hypothetical protein
MSLTEEEIPASTESFIASMNRLKRSTLFSLEKEMAARFTKPLKGFLGKKIIHEAVAESDVFGNYFQMRNTHPCQKWQSGMPNGVFNSLFLR